MLTIRVNAEDVVNVTDNLAVTQIPYALAKAVSLTGLDFQDAERKHFEDVFTLRHRSFVEQQGVKVLAFPTKARPEMTIGQDPRADFLEKFELGTPKTGEPNIAVPVDIRPDIAQILSAAQRPRALFADPKASQVFEIKPGQSSHLPPGIYQRAGKAGGLLFLYALTPSAKIPPELQFEETAERVINERWSINFSQAFDIALRNAKVNGEPVDLTPLGTTEGE